MPLTHLLTRAMNAGRRPRTPKRGKGPVWPDQHLLTLAADVVQSSCAPVRSLIPSLIQVRPPGFTRPLSAVSPQVADGGDLR